VLFELALLAIYMSLASGARHALAEQRRVHRHYGEVLAAEEFLPPQDERAVFDTSTGERQHQPTARPRSRAQKPDGRLYYGRPARGDSLVDFSRREIVAYRCASGWVLLELGGALEMAVIEQEEPRRSGRTEAAEMRQQRDQVRGCGERQDRSGFLESKPKAPFQRAQNSLAPLRDCLPVMGFARACVAGEWLDPGESSPRIRHVSTRDQLAWISAGRGSPGR
jgi:hypothetical protein